MFKGLLNKLSKKDLLNPTDENLFVLNTSSEGENLRKELIEDINKYYNDAFKDSLESSIKVLIKTRLNHHFFKKEYGEKIYKDTITFMENYKAIEKISEYFLINDIPNLRKDYATSKKYNTSSLNGTLWSNFNHLDLVISASRIDIQGGFTTVLNNAKGERELVNFDLMPVVTPNNFVSEKEVKYNHMHRVESVLEYPTFYDLFSIKLDFLADVIYDSVKDELLAEFTKPEINLD